MANKLNIYACSGIGAAAESRKYDYWLDNTQTVSNTQAVNTLLALINEQNAEIMYLRNIDQAGIIERLNYIDLLSVCLVRAQLHDKDTDGLVRDGMVIGSMVADGLFSYNETDYDKRDNHLDALLAAADELFVSASNLQPSEEFTAWWNEYVIKRNRVGLSKEKQQAVTAALSSGGVGASDYNENKDLAEYLNNASDYFLYTYFTPDQVSVLPRTVKTKKKQQDKIYNYCKGLFVDVYGSQAEMDRIIRTQLIARYGETPEQVCTEIASGLRGAIGFSWAIFLKIMALIVVPIVIAAINAICDACARTNEAKYAAVDKIAIDGGVPNEDDWSGLSTTGSTSLMGGGSLWMWLIGGLGLWWILKK